MKKTIFTYSALILAVVLFTLGIADGQNTDVLTKAIRICLECVGIG